MVDEKNQEFCFQHFNTKKCRAFITHFSSKPYQHIAYADIARFMGWGTDKQSDAELVEVLAQKVYELGVAVGINMNWKGQGVTKKLLQDTVYTLADHAYEDQGTTC